MMDERPIQNMSVTKVCLHDDVIFLLGIQREPYAL